MDVSVIIVNYNSGNLIKDCLDSVFEKTIDVSFEVIIVDNASKDNSIEFLNNEFGSRIKIINAGSNLGFGRANNLGAESAQGEFLFFLNPDTFLLNNAIKILVDFLKKDKKCGVAGGNLYKKDLSPNASYYSFENLDSERKNSSWLEILKPKFQSNKTKEKIVLKTKNDVFNYTDNILKVDYIIGADMMVPKEVFESSGGFDKDFFMYSEEEELQYRITKMGYDVVSVPDAKIIHLEGATQKDNSGTLNESNAVMRINSMFLYYKKVFGEESVKKVYKYRINRLKKLILLSKLSGKSEKVNAYKKSIEVYNKVYSKFMEEL